MMNEIARTGLHTSAADEQQPFLARWSRRKLGQNVMSPVGTPDSGVPVTESLPDAMSPHDAMVAVEVEEPVDPRTGKRMSELTDEDMPDPESLDENSDLAMFMAEKVSNTLRMKALTKVFHTAKFNQVCVCAEYAEDYTSFTPLGNIVPHDLRQAIVREAGRLCERLAGKGLRMTPEDAQERIAAEFRGESLPDLEPLLEQQARADEATDSVPGDASGHASGDTSSRTADQPPERLSPPDSEST